MDLIAIGEALVRPKQAQARLLDPSEGRELIEAMREWSGREEVTHAYCVVAQPGKEITLHDHPEDVVLFYPQPGCTVIVDGEEINPDQGQMLLIPKKTLHRVPKNEWPYPRVSIAAKVSDE